MWFWWGLGGRFDICESSGDNKVPDPDDRWWVHDGAVVARMESGFDFVVRSDAGDGGLESGMLHRTGFWILSVSAVLPWK